MSMIEKAVKKLKLQRNVNKDNPITAKKTASPVNRLTKSTNKAADHINDNLAPHDPTAKKEVGQDRTKFKPLDSQPLIELNLVDDDITVRDHDLAEIVETATYSGYDEDNSFIKNLKLEDVSEYEDDDSTEIDHRFEYQDDDMTDITDMDEDDITDILGFEGFKIRSKKSNFSNNVHIDLDRMNELGFITPKHPDTVLSSIFRRIKRPILDNAANRNATIVDHPNMVMITSSVANEGKTYCSTNLAISIAMEKDLHVLLIDADIKKPSLAKTFDIEAGKGLTDILMGDVTNISEVLHSTNIPTLSIMFAGTLHPNGTELLSSEAMKKFVHETATRYSDRIVIFDSPPLLQTTESSVLSSHMGQVALVVEAERTKSPQVKKSLHLISSEIKLLILNKQREKKNDLDYGYGYGY